MEEEDQIRYETLFYSQKLEDGFLSGDGARAFFIRSKLPLHDLTRIWKLSDVSHDDKLNVFEFSIAMHLIELKLCGQEIPSQLEASVFHNVKNAVIIPSMTTKEKQQLEKIFQLKDSSCQGYLERDVLQPMFLVSGLSPFILSKIWNIADLDRDGKLSFLEFAIAFHLVKNCIEGVHLNGPVNPFRCLPDEENAIHLCKDKLKIFDKEFLLEQKERGKENNFFSYSYELSDNDLDILAEYLPNTANFIKDKNEADFMDENCNTSRTSKGLPNTTLEENQNTGFHSMEFASQMEFEKSVVPTDNIECHQMPRNELTLDLDHIFEVVGRENVEHCNEEPKFVARLEQTDLSYSEVDGGMQEKDDGITDVLPIPRKKTYFGKQLIFEDPIGSETIGDVEFEVDFEEITKDIEKEPVDEERRLPIALVFPINRSRPVANEEPLEKQTATKHSHEVDWHFFTDQDVKSERITDLEEKRKHQSSDIDSEGRETVENSVINIITSGSLTKGAKEKLNTVAPEPSNDYNRDMPPNNDTHMWTTKNWDMDHEGDSVADIVEQKRKIMQSQLEERRKLREKHLHTEMTNSSDILKPYLALAKPSSREVHEKQERERGHVEGKWYVNKQERQTETNKGPLISKDDAVVEKKEIRLLDIQSSPKGETVASRKTSAEVEDLKKSGSEQNETFVEKNLTQSTGTREVKYWSKTPKEEISQPNVDEEEEKRRLEAQHRELLLLERIKFLERKRQKLLEEKQRELKSKSIVCDWEQDSSKSEQEMQTKRTAWESARVMNVQLNQNNDGKSSGYRYEETRNNNAAKIQSVDVWSQSPGQLQKESSDNHNNEVEEKRLALAVEAKRKSEAELEKRRETELREAEKRRLEQMAKEEEERQAAKERKRNFLENLEKLKQRVVTEEARTSEPSDQTKRVPQRPETRCGRGENSGKLSSYSRSSTENYEATSNKSSESKELTKKEPTAKRDAVKDVLQNPTIVSQKTKQLTDSEQIFEETPRGVRNAFPSERNDSKEVNPEQKKNPYLNEDEIRRENFKSNRELFMKKVQAEENANVEVARRNKSRKARPKSYYGGMFKTSAHRTIDAALHAPDDSTSMENGPDFVDEEALEQFRREEELRKEHQKVSEHRRSLQRDSSYTVENVEMFWEADTNREPQKDLKISGFFDKKQVKPSSNPHRRSLVDTLTTEWNSLLDVLEKDQRRKSETVKMSQEVSDKRKQPSLQNRAENMETNCQQVKDVKIDASKEIVRCHVNSVNKQILGSDLEVFANQSGKVKQMVNAYKRLSAPCLLEQDIQRNPSVLHEKSEREVQKENYDLHKSKLSKDERAVHTQTNPRSQTHLKRQEPLNSDDVYEIDNTPRRKSDLAHLWSNVVSHQ